MKDNIKHIWECTECGWVGKTEPKDGMCVRCKNSGLDGWMKIVTVVRCCNSDIQCHGDVACPRCGTEYNSAGQELADRRYWGEETGESLAEILTAKLD